MTLLPIPATPEEWHAARCGNSSGRRGRRHENQPLHPPARVEIMRALYPVCVEYSALLDAINALPGPTLTLNSIMHWAKNNGVRKTEETLRAIKQQNNKVGLAAIHAARVTHLTPLREAALRRHWPDPTMSVREVFAAMNAADPALAPTTAKKSLYRYVQKLGLPLPRFAGGRKVLRQKAPKPERHQGAIGAVDLSMQRPGFVVFAPPVPADLTPEEQTARVDAMLERKQERALAMLRKKACPHAVASAARLPLREVFRLSAQVRA